MEVTGFDKLQRIASGIDGALLLVGPIILLTVLGVFFGILVAYRRRQESKSLSAAPETTLATTSSDLGREEQAAPSPTAAPASSQPPAEQISRESWLAALTKGLARSRQALTSSLKDLFSTNQKIDGQVLEKIHETLYRADVGVKTTDRLIDSLKRKFAADASSGETDWSSVKSHLIEEITAILSLDGAAQPLNENPNEKPHVVLIVGVNGVGKTTTIGKLTARRLAAGRKVLLAAADTFRAAAIEQLEVWGKRLGVDVIRQQQGSDPAAVAYDGLKAAMARQTDLLIIDTAGRLHSKTELMDELAKIHRVLGRDLPGAPHETWLVIDATTGQNAANQVRAFKEAAKITGLIVTKLDGTAKGGVIIGIADQFKIPIRYIGVGEKAEDLQPFDAADFAKALF